MRVLVLVALMTASGSDVLATESACAPNLDREVRELRSSEHVANFGVTFTMLAQQHVRGPNAHPIFQKLGRRAGAPGWNFNKYLSDRNGKLVKRFENSVEPMSIQTREAVKALL